MSKNKYTAGPWKAGWTISYNGQSKLGWNVTDAKATELLIGIPDGPEAEANAHLIAAAPDLLEALKQLMKLYTETDFDVCGLDLPFVYKTEAIIAKAEGGMQHE